MKTNIELDEALIEEAMRVTGEKTKTGVVHRGLRELVRVAGLQRMLDHRGHVKWEGNLDQMRERQPQVARDDHSTYGTARRHKRTR